MVPRWLRNTACIAVASATLFMQAAVNAAADVDGNSSGGGADTGEVSGATAEGGIVAKVIGGHEAGGGVAARDNATTLGSGREPGDPPADPARVSDPPSNDATTTSDTTSTSDDTTSNSTENSTATETSNSTETTQTSNEEPEVKLPPSVDPSTEETASPTPALFSDLPTPSATPSVNNTESSTTTGSDYAEVAQTAVTVPAVPTEVAAAPSATVVASAVPDPPAAEPAPVPVAALLTPPPAPEVAPAAVVVPATDPITVLQVVLTSAVTTLILAPIAQVSAWFGDGWPPPTGPGSPSPARKWSEPGVTTRAADLSSMLNESQQVQPRSMHAAPLSSNIGGAAMGQVLIPVDEPVPALVAAEAPDVPSDGVGAFLRDAFNEIVHSPPLMVLVIAALPGLAGLIFLTSVGMRLGYCQAKAGLVLRASGLARFAPTGPLGVVRSGSFIVLHQRKAAPRHRVFKDVAGFKGHKDVTSLKHLKDSA